MTSHQFEQDERKNQLIEDLRAHQLQAKAAEVIGRMVKPDTSTFQSRAIAEQDDVSGRWAKENKTNITGTTPIPQVPAGPNWSNGPQPGIEPPLGFSVEAMEPTGNFHEIERSLRELGNSPGGVVARGAGDSTASSSSLTSTEPLSDHYPAGDVAERRDGDVESACVPSGNAPLPSRPTHSHSSNRRR